jgi:hypothetical protein
VAAATVRALNPETTAASLGDRPTNVPDYKCMAIDKLSRLRTISPPDREDVASGLEAVRHVRQFSVGE